MQVTVKGFIYHKEAETFEDCFDRYAINIVNHKFCVSDGVSKSFFPGVWAELLVENFVANPGKINLTSNDLFKSVQKKWKDEVFKIANRPNQKYFVKNYFAQGRSAAATFVGLDFFYDNGKPYWEAFALGDSFLFFVPKNISNLDVQFDEIQYLSSKKDFEFDNFPDFFDSIQLINKGKIKQSVHKLNSGTFYLMTDALSEWFIKTKQSAILEMNSWDSQKMFERRMSFLRKNGLQNDDAAVLMIDVIDDFSNRINYGNINLSNLKALQGIPENEKQSNYSQEIKNIEEKFLKASKGFQKDEVANLPKSDSIPEQQDYISVRKKNKKKKRGWIQVVRGIFSSKSFDSQINRHDVDNSSDNFKYKSKEKRDEGDIDSITNKF